MKFKATHKLAYDKGVWLPVMLDTRKQEWVTRDGRRFPIDPNTLVIPL